MARVRARVYMQRTMSSSCRSMRVFDEKWYLPGEIGVDVTVVGQVFGAESLVREIGRSGGNCRVVWLI